MFAFPYLHGRVRIACLAGAAAVVSVLGGIGAAAWLSGSKTATGQLAAVPVSAVLESGEWANSPSFWEKRAGNGGRWMGGGTSGGSGASSGRSNLGGDLGAIGRAEQAPTPEPVVVAPGRSGVYRTVCVRLCDGYYFPIKAATTSATFDEDSETCRSSCSSAARLFVYPTDTGSPDEMHDTAGRPYAKLPTAFLYRTNYDASCTCRAHPWEQAATDKHKLYAAEANAKRFKSAQERKKALAALEPLRKQISVADMAAKKAGEIQGRDILARLAKIEASGLIHQASASVSRPAGRTARGKWSNWSDWSSGEPVDGMMRLGGPRRSAVSTKKSSSRKSRRR